MGAIQQTLAAAGASVGLLFDDFSMTNAGLWDLQKVRSDYTGYAVRAALAADSGATTLDIGFLPDGSFDMAAYSAFGTGLERVITWYDQSGNGFDLSRAWSATLCPVIRTSSYNSKPAIYFNGTGNLGNAGFTNWNGKADVNVLVACRTVSNTAGSVISGGPAGTFALYGGYIGWYIFENGYSAYNRFLNAWERRAGMLYRVRFDGGASAADRLTLYSNDQILTTSSEGTDPGSTWTNKTGIYINAESNGTSNPKDNEYYGVYYFGQDIDADWTALKAGIAEKFYATTDSQIMFSGDSMTVSYNLNGIDPTNTYPLQTKALLETDTGRGWNVPGVTTTAEIAAALARIDQLADLNGVYLIDDWQQHRIVVCWGGTNDLALGGTAADALTASGALAAQWQTYGASKVYFLNMLPRTDQGAGNGAFATKRGTYNAGIAAALPAGVDLVDVAAIAALQDSTNLTYYFDDVHLTLAGYALVADAVRDAVVADL